MHRSILPQIDWNPLKYNYPPASMHLAQDKYSGIELLIQSIREKCDISKSDKIDLTFIVSNCNFVIVIIISSSITFQGVIIY